MTRTFAFPALIEQDEESKLISFRDIPECNWFAVESDGEDVIEEARKALMISIGYYFKNKTPVPFASKKKKGETVVDLPPSFVAKIILHNVMLENNVRPADLAKRMDVPTSEVARITNPKTKTKIDTLADAVKASGGLLQLAY